MSTPVVTVIVPGRDVAAFAEEALASLRAQTLTNWCAVLVDDGSVDATGSLVLLMPEHRATERIVTELAQVFSRHPGDTEVTLKLHKSGVAKVFEVPAQVRVTVDLYGELKGLLGPQCLG